MSAMDAAKRKELLLNDSGPKLPITIRKANDNDYEAVSALEALELAFHKEARSDSFTSSESVYPREEFEELLSHPCPICWLAIYAETYEKMGMQVQYYRMEANPVAKND